VQGVITKWYYYNSPFYYPRLIANPIRPGMLFSSGDSPKHFHRFFRGRDSMKGNTESRRYSFLPSSDPRASAGDLYPICHP